jgi:hypothetical protein
MSDSFQKMATLTISTKRPPSIVDGKRGVPAENLSGVKALPLDPVDPEVRIRLELDTPYEVLQTMVEDGVDILAEDIVVAGGVEYVVRAVGEWNWRPAGTDTLLVILEQLVS